MEFREVVKDVVAPGRVLGVVGANVTGVEVASKSQGEKADSAVQPADLSAALAGKQDKDATLDELSGATLTAWAKSWLAIANAGAARSTLGLAPVAESGAYADLTGTPDIAGIAEGVVNGGAADREALRRGIMRDAVAWWRAADYDGSGVLADGSGRGHDMTLGAGAAAPTFLPYEGRKYLYMPAGSAPGNVGCADDPALDVTDLDFRIQVEMDVMPPGAAAALANRAAPDPNRAWRFYLSAAGVPVLNWWPDGTDASSTVRNATAAVPVAAGTKVWLRVTMDVDNGAGGFSLAFYYSTADEPSSWTQIGSTVTGGAPTTIPAVTAGLQIGAGTLGTQGKIYKAEQRASIDGPVAWTWSAEDMGQSGGTSGGRTWTINRAASGKKATLVDRPLFLFGTDDYMQAADHPDFALPQGQDFTVILAVRHPNPAADTAMFLASKKADAGGTSPGWAVYKSNASANVLGYFGNGSSFLTSAAAGGLPAGVPTVMMVRRSGTTSVFRSNDVQGSGVTVTGDFTSAEPFRIGSLGTSGGFYANVEFLGAAFFRRALTWEETAAVAAVLGVDPGGSLLPRNPNTLAALLRSQPASGALTTGPAVIEGTGSPEGVVAAPVGTMYRDTAGTNGAVLWCKASGTGNTGWRVVQGDTGWRVVTGELLNGWTASIVRIRRTAEAVWWHVEGLDGTSSTDLAFLPNFPGFDSGLANLPRFVLHTTASAVRRGYRGATAMTMASDGASGSLYGTFSAVPAASTPWPTTLPGSA